MKLCKDGYYFMYTTVYRNIKQTERYEWYVSEIRTLKLSNRTDNLTYEIFLNLSNFGLKV